MHVAIYETVHFENIAPLLRLFDLPGNRITVFCDEEARQQAIAQLKNDADRFEWKLQKSGQSRREFLTEAKRYIRSNAVDLLYINTISDNFIHLNRLIKAGKDMRTVATLHVINGYFSPQLKFNLRRVVRVVGKWLLRRSIQEYAIQSDSMLPAARRMVDAGYPIYCIPGAVFNPNHYTQPSSQTLHLVVAGSVDSRRRDYNDVSELINQLERNQQPVKLTILGGTDSDFGKQMIAQWSRLSLQFVQLKYYDSSLIPQDEYDRVLASSHFIFHPSTRDAVLEDGAKESYGHTVCSGVFSDAIRHARPLIIPSFLATDSRFKNSCFRYDVVSQIADFLQSLNNPAGLQRWMEAAHRTSLDFTVEKIRLGNPSLFSA